MRSDVSLIEPLVVVIAEPAQLAYVRQRVRDFDCTALASASFEAGLRLVAVERPHGVAVDVSLVDSPVSAACTRLRAAAATAGTRIALLQSGERDGEIAALSPTDRDGLTVLSKQDLAADLARWLQHDIKSMGESVARKYLQFHDIVLDARRFRAYRGDRPLRLTPKEFQLLWFFLERPGCVASRDEIKREVWGTSVHVVERTVDVHISRLRRLLTANGECNVIRAVRSAGYALDFDDYGRIGY